MARKEINTFWDRGTRNDINDNFEELYGDIKNVIDSITDEIIQEILEETLDHSKLSWKEPVETKDDLPAEGNEVGDVHYVDEEFMFYRWNGESWVGIQDFDISVLNTVNERIDDVLDELEVVKNKPSIVVSDTEPEDADIWFEVVE